MFFLNLTPNRNNVTVLNKNQLSEQRKSSLTSACWATDIMSTELLGRANPDENMFHNVVFLTQIQITLFVPSGAIRFAASSIIQITHNHTPNTEIAYLTGMAKNNKNSKQSIYGKSISYLCFVLELRSKMAAGTKECLYLLVLNFGSLKRDPDGNI